MTASSYAAVPYATPVPRSGARAWAGVGILFGGLCLIGLGGCFLIGVLAVVNAAAFQGTVQNAPTPPLSGPQFILMLVLYLLAFSSFGGATMMLVAGTRGLLKFVRG